MSKEKGKKKAKSDKTAGTQKGKITNPFQMADRMASALADGTIDEFLDKELPGNEKAKKLARLMAGAQSSEISGQSMNEGKKPDQMPQEKTTLPGPGGEEEILDQLNSIAAQNNLSLDWLVMRALKIYISEYLRTGKL